MKNVLIISAHADDEAFGMGGTILKLSDDKNYTLHWLILSSIWSPKWSNEAIEERDNAIQNISKICNIESVTKWEYKDNLLDTYSVNELQERLIKTLNEIRPSIIYTPSPWDFNFEHKLAYELVEMSTKPYYSPFVERIIAYEIPSSTESSFSINKNFIFNHFVNIEKYIQQKNDLIDFYKSELYEFPHPRSKEYLINLSKIRGAQSGMKNAEGFCIIRDINI